MGITLHKFKLEHKWSLKEEVLVAKTQVIKILMAHNPRNSQQIDHKRITAKTMEGKITPRDKEHRTYSFRTRDQDHKTYSFRITPDQGLKRLRMVCGQEIQEQESLGTMDSGTLIQTMSTTITGHTRDYQYVHRRRGCIHHQVLGQEYK